MMATWSRFVVAAALCVGFQAAVHAGNVPGFLAGRRPAAHEAVQPPENWTAVDNIRWKADLPGLGWSSPVVWGQRVFLTTCINTGGDRAPRKGLYIEDLDANKYPKLTDNHQWKVYCLDLETGRVLWERIAHEGIPPRPHHLKNTLASETPCTDGQRLYACFGNVGLFCYDFDGRLLWTRPFEPRETHYGWGTSISPIVHDGRVYIVNDNEEESYLAALDAATGNELWRIPRAEKTNYATPYIWSNGRRTQLVTSGIGWARSYDLDGMLLWQLKGRSILAIPTPFAHGDLLYLTSGHVMWGDNPVYAIRPTAEGDLTPSDDPAKPLSQHLAWYQPKAGPYHPTPLVVGDQLYILYDRGFLAAYDALTGREIYPRKRIPNGRAFTSSPWTYGGKLYCLNEDGVTFVLRTGKEFEILDTNPLAEDDMCMATPAIVGSKLLIRSSARLYCVEDARPAVSAK